MDFKFRAPGKVTRRDGLALLLILALLLAAGWLEIPPQESTAPAMAAALAAQRREEEQAQRWEDDRAATLVEEAEPAGEAEDEGARIDAALVAQGYFRQSVPLPYAHQDFLQTACERWGAPYALALGVVEIESGFTEDARNLDCVGYMQIKKSNFQWLREAAGAEPTEPGGNLTAGVYMLWTRLDRYDGDTERALMAYNMGPSGAEKARAAGTRQTRYTRLVLEAAEVWEEALKK